MHPRQCQQSFTARRVASFEPRIRQIVHRLIDQLIGDGRADLVDLFNYPFPALVIFNLIGVPQAGQDDATAFAHPERFDVQLLPGRAVARLEMRVAWDLT